LSAPGVFSRGWRSRVQGARPRAPSKKQAPLLEVVLMPHMTVRGRRLDGDSKMRVPRERARLASEKGRLRFEPCIQRAGDFAQPPSPGAAVADSAASPRPLHWARGAGSGLGSAQLSRVSAHRAKWRRRAGFHPADCSGSGRCGQDGRRGGVVASGCATRVARPVRCRDALGAEPAQGRAGSG